MPCRSGCGRSRRSQLQSWLYLWLVTTVGLPPRRGYSALLRIPHQMIGRIAKLDVDGVYSLEIGADVQFVAHTHAAMELHGLLCDEAGGVANLRLRARRQLRSIWLPSREAEVQMLRER